MYGNSPEVWSQELKGPERWRVITNYLTRMRFCTEQGQLELSTKDRLEMPQPFNPWYSYRREDAAINIVFGHWAALQGRDCGKNLFALDTGYVWGGSLRIMELETEKLFHQCPEKT
jgi:bis(5'-nucleosyl)-tetraphosphatase (symmetrical)